MNMKDLKPKLQKIYHWLKERPSTHIAAISSLINTIVIISLILLDSIFAYSDGSQGCQNLEGVTIIAFILLYVLIYICIFIITSICFIIECVKKFNWRIKRKFLLENKIYNFFWVSGILCYIIIGCIVVFQYI